MAYTGLKKSRLREKSALLAAFVVACAAMAAISMIGQKTGKGMKSGASMVDLREHPLYSRYQFHPNDSTINIGVQPFYLPTGIILEAMKRDQILLEAMSESDREIRYYPFLKGADVNFFLGKKMLEGGIGGDMPALTAASTLDVVISLALQKGNVSIISTRPMLSNAMKGKRIAYPEGSISHYFLLDLLRSSGISIDQAVLVPMEATAMPAALANKEIDAFSAWEPITASAIKQCSDFFVAYKNITTGYLYFRKDFAKKDREALFHILAAAVRAVKILKSDGDFLISACRWNKEEMERLSGEKSVLTAEEMAKLALDDILGYYSLHESLVIREEDIQAGGPLYEEHRFLKDLGEIPGDMAWERARESFDHGLISEVLRSPKKYRLNEFDYAE